MNQNTDKPTIIVSMITARFEVDKLKELSPAELRLCTERLAKAIASLSDFVDNLSTANNRFNALDFGIKIEADTDGLDEHLLDLIIAKDFLQTLCYCDSSKKFYTTKAKINNLKDAQNELRQIQVD
jgi:hypothetical protein